MLLYVTSLSQFALGSFDDFTAAEAEQFEKYVGTELTYRMITVPWTTVEATLNVVRDKLIEVINLDQQCVIVWDPVLPRNYPDSMQAILDGLAEDYIKTFFNLISGIQQQYSSGKFTPIILIGSSVNTPQSYSVDPQLFV